MAATWSTRAGLLLWVAQPLSILCELIAAAWSRAPYSLLHNTISDLGARSCTEIRYPSRLVEVCSPAHALINVSFVVLGLAMAVGAVLLRPSLPYGKLTTAATVLWVIGGLSSIATGLVPLDVMLELHALVSIPGIALPPVAALLLGIALGRTVGRSWWIVAAVGVASTLAGGVFLVRIDYAYGGLLERLAIWPVLIAVAAIALRARPRAHNLQQ